MAGRAAPVTPGTSETELHVDPLFEEVTKPRASPVVLVQSDGKSGWVPYGVVALTEAFERMNEPYTLPLVPVANVGIAADGHWHVEFPRICGAPQLVPFVEESVQATFVEVQEVRFAPPVALHPRPTVVSIE